MLQHARDLALTKHLPYLILGTALLGGIMCGPSQPPLPMMQREMVGFWRPHLLYLKRSPHSSLYVEIDAVEGSEPGVHEIARLEEFLERYCDKPAGIRIVCDPVIPRSQAHGESEESLALRYLDGPPVHTAQDQPAFLYVLFYDSAACPGEDATLSRIPTKPHVKLLPYPAAIFVDRRYNPWGHDMWDLFLMHEMGHLLGLTRNLDHGDGMHCKCRSCLMNEKARMGFWRWLFGKERPQGQDDLCELCQRDLEAYRQRSCDRNLRFIGPVLARSEQAYHVLSLPGFVELYVGPLAGLDHRNILEDARRAASSLRSGRSVWIYYRTEAGRGDGGESVRRALESARQDPYELVRRIAEKEMAQLAVHSREGL